MIRLGTVAMARIGRRMPVEEADEDDHFGVMDPASEPDEPVDGLALSSELAWRAPPPPPPAAAAAVAAAAPSSSTKDDDFVDIPSSEQLEESANGDGRTVTKRQVKQQLGNFAREGKELTYLLGLATVEWWKSPEMRERRRATAQTMVYYGGQVALGAKDVIVRNTPLSRFARDPQLGVETPSPPPLVDVKQSPKSEKETTPSLSGGDSPIFESRETRVRSPSFDIEAEEDPFAGGLFGDQDDDEGGVFGAMGEEGDWDF